VDKFLLYFFSSFWLSLNSGFLDKIIFSNILSLMNKLIYFFDFSASSFNKLFLLFILRCLVRFSSNTFSVKSFTCPSILLSICFLNLSLCSFSSFFYSLFLFIFLVILKFNNDFFYISSYFNWFSFTIFNFSSVIWLFSLYLFYLIILSSITGCKFFNFSCLIISILVNKPFWGELLNLLFISDKSKIWLSSLSYLSLLKGSRLFILSSLNSSEEAIWISPLEGDSDLEISTMGSFAF